MRGTLQALPFVGQFNQAAWHSMQWHGRSTQGWLIRFCQMCYTVNGICAYRVVCWAHQHCLFHMLTASSPRASLLCCLQVTAIDIHADKEQEAKKLGASRWGNNSTDCQCRALLGRPAMAFSWSSAATYSDINVCAMPMGRKYSTEVLVKQSY